jgi:hypothetical protein
MMELSLAAARSVLVPLLGVVMLVSLVVLAYAL